MRFYRSQRLVRQDLQAHIYSQALLDNIRNLRSLCKPKTKFCAVVKANAYGHGITETVNILKKAEVDFFAVASIYEAIHILDLIKKQSILILEPINSTYSPDQVMICAKKDLHCVLSSPEDLKFVSKILASDKYVLKVHVNIESGMGRNGLDPKIASELIAKIDRSPNVTLTGVYTHLSTADEEDLSYVYEQLEKFNNFLDNNMIRKRDNILIHAANSAATIKIPQSHFDMVRCGIAMYGYYSRPMSSPPVDLKPVMKLQAPIVKIKKISAGLPVSYGRSFITERDTTVAIIPIGYADGYWRSFSNKAKMKIGEKVVLVIGRVCMDQLLIDVTDVPGASVGQMVTVIDNDQKSPCGAYALAELADTICYEIPICVQAHVNRIVH